MAGYIRKINAKYINNFKNKVRQGLLSLYENSHTEFIRVIASEVNKLFSIMSGRSALKNDIPKPTHYPESEKFNKFLDNIGIDVDKLYQAQNLINSDVQNVANFNSLERTKSVNNLGRVQNKVYSIFIKSKAITKGITQIVENFKIDDLPEGSSNVQIDLSKESLILASKRSIQNRTPIQKDVVNVFFVDRPSESLNIYPNNSALALGSFWKRGTRDYHFILKDSPNIYKEKMVDGSQADDIGTVEFEAMYTPRTTNGENIRVAVEEHISNEFVINPSFVMVDVANSLHGQYISDEALSSRLTPRLKLVIPINNATINNGMIIDFDPNDAFEVPSIIPDQSFVYDLSNRKRKFFSITQEEFGFPGELGQYKLMFEEPLTPTRLELVINYSESPWASISRYFMSGYKFDASKSIRLDTRGGSAISVAFTKVAYIFVDTQSDERQERSRANKVMQAQGVDK